MTKARGADELLYGQNVQPGPPQKAKGASAYNLQSKMIWLVYQLLFSERLPENDPKSPLGKRQGSGFLLRADKPFLLCQEKAESARYGADFAWIDTRISVDEEDKVTFDVDLQTKDGGSGEIASYRLYSGEKIEEAYRVLVLEDYPEVAEALVRRVDYLLRLLREETGGPFSGAR